MGADFHAMMFQRTPEEQVDLVLGLMRRSAIPVDQGRDALVLLLKGAEASGWRKGNAAGVEFGAKHAEAAGHHGLAATIRNAAQRIAAEAASAPDDDQDEGPAPSTPIRG